MEKQKVIIFHIFAYKLPELESEVLNIILTVWKKKSRLKIN